MITDRINYLDNTMSCYQLIITVQLLYNFPQKYKFQLKKSLNNVNYTHFNIMIKNSLDDLVAQWLVRILHLSGFVVGSSPALKIVLLALHFLSSSITIT